MVEEIKQLRALLEYFRGEKIPVTPSAINHLFDGRVKNYLITMERLGQIVIIDGEIYL